MTIVSNQQNTRQITYSQIKILEHVLGLDLSNGKTRVIRNIYVCHPDNRHWFELKELETQGFVKSKNNSDSTTCFWVTKEGRELLGIGI